MPAATQLGSPTRDVLEEHRRAALENLSNIRKRLPGKDAIRQPHPALKHLIHLIERKLEELNWTRDKVGKLLGVTGPTVSKWLSGAIPIPGYQLAKLLTVTGIIPVDTPESRSPVPAPSPAVDASTSSHQRKEQNGGSSFSQVKLGVRGLA